jgi:hypothetical protein
MKPVLATVLIVVAMVVGVELGVGVAHADPFDPHTCTVSPPTDPRCLNGNVPSYDNPNCWPGAIWCPAANEPDDTTAVEP